MVMYMKKDIIIKIENTPPKDGMFCYAELYLYPSLHSDSEIDQPPSTIVWLMEAVITLLRGLGPRKIVIS